MGKSPGKWIKTVLFGRKATRSNSTRGRSVAKTRNDKGLSIARESPTSIENSLVISTPILVRAHSNDIKSEPEKENSPNFDIGSSVADVDAETQTNSGATLLNNHREEKAATKAQAAFRGFLARRAFRALKGIIRLQALFRGHLVRRQAVVTLHSMLGIVKFQSLVRGQKVRTSDIGLEIKTKLAQGKEVSNSKPLRKNKLYSNVFVSKLFSSSLVIMPLQIKHNKEDPGSVHSWMQRWTASQFWKLQVQPKKNPETKSQPKRGSYAMETESGKQKRASRRNSNADSNDLEKPKQVQKKTVASSSNAALEHPQTELEKVKRGLRKVSSANTEPIIKEKKKDVESISESKPEPQPVISVVVEELVDPCNAPQAEKTCDENQKTGKRRASFSTKLSEYTENNVQNVASVPSYMQATKSAKAKLRQNSPSSLNEKSNASRRHSLPSPLNGKGASNSPRTHKILQASGKGSVRNDGSLSFSRDSIEKPIQVEWRR